MNRRERLSLLIDRYLLFKEEGRLELSSEETIRTWINEMFAIFEWDVMDTSQVLQERSLSEVERERLTQIDSTSTRPDYTLKRGAEKLTFLDAKAISVSLETNSAAAFQIKSYGWSISAPCAFITNFEEFAIYDCTYVPSREQDANLGRIYLRIGDYIDNFELLENHLLRTNILNNKLNLLYSNTVESVQGTQRLSPDIAFAKELSSFRLALAIDILENNRTIINNNSELLAYITQVVINRVIFIRICEARRIEREGLLIEFKNNGFWESFKESSYNNFYDHYDGPLFDRITIINQINISDNVFDMLIESLYYPSPYRFDVVPTKLLSDIYELFLAKKLFIENNNVNEKLKLEYIKTNGAVSTPQYLVRDLLKRTIPKNKLLENGLDGVFGTSILDFACGSGVFLVEIFDYLKDIIIEYYLTNNPSGYDSYFFRHNNETTLTIYGRRELISKCIYAVDIDPEAVEVARMSLSLKIIDTIEFHENYQEIGLYGDQILRNIGNNIKCGNTLVSSDIREEYDLINRDEEQLLKTNPFDWDSEINFLNIFLSKNGFDFIVGNPPYVEVKNYNLEYPYMHHYIKDKYQTATNGKVDLSVVFIERAMQLLNNNGKIGLIIQSRFFKTDYGKKIRKFISQDSLLSQVIYFETTELFKNRITYISFLILDKARKNNIFFKRINENVELIPNILNNLLAVEVDNTSFTEISSNAFDHNPWNFEDVELLRIKTNLINNFGTFGEYVNVRVGIQVLWDKAYHLKVKRINNDGTMLCDTKLEEDVTIEINACRPLIVNRRFYPYCKDNTDTYVLFPYKIIENRNVEILFDEFGELYPFAADYLSRHELIIKENVLTYTDNRWHLFTRENNHARTYPKVLIPMTALDTFATVTNNPRNYCDNANMFFVDIPIRDEDNLYAISGIINSTLFSVCARSIANPQQGGYFKFNKQFLEPIPFPRDNYTNNPEIVRNLARISKDIESNQIRYINGTPRQKNIITETLRRLWKMLDDKVYLLYQLNQNDISFFIERGRNIDRIEILN